MVIRDSGADADPEKLPKNGLLEPTVGHSGPSPMLAAPVDRFAAFVIDYIIILMPLLYLVAAPFQRVLKEAALFEQDWRFTAAVTLAAFALTFVILFYQTACHWLWSATAGKFLFGLRVVPVFRDQKMTFSQSLYRSFYWAISWLLFGVPFLSVYSNLKRRTIYDRLSDTIVIARRKERRAEHPSLNERAFVQSVFWAVGAFLLLIITTQILVVLKERAHKAEIVSALGDEGALCTVVSDTQSELGESADQEYDRLSLALSLFAMGLADQSCLEAEVTYRGSTEVDNSMSLLAKSFVYSEQKDLSDLYLAKICNTDKESYDCKLSQIIEAVANDDQESVEQVFLKVEAETKMQGQPPLYFLSWGLQQSLAREDYLRAEKFFDQIPKAQSLSDYNLVAQTKILWALNRANEARGVESAAYQVITPAAKLELASFMCGEELWNHCEARESHSCQEFGKLVEQDHDLLQSEQVALTYLNRWDCDNQNVASLESFTEMPFSDDVHRWLVETRKPKSVSDSVAYLTKEKNLKLKYQGLRRLLTDAISLDDLVKIQSAWQGEAHSLSWQKLGEILSLSFFKKNQFAKSLEVAESLFQSGLSVSTERWEQAIVAAYKLGDWSRAKGYLQSYFRRQDKMIEVTTRMPAQEDNFTEIVKTLLRDGL